MSPFTVLAALRLVLARHRWLHWLAVALLAAGAALTVEHRADRLAAAQRAWGRSVVVQVTVGPVARGDPVVTRAARVPQALVPDGAVEGDAMPAGSVAAHGLARGEIVVEGDLAGGDLPDGGVVLRVPATLAGGATAGDRVTLYGNGTALCDGDVVAVAADGADLALPPDCAGDVGVHLAAGTLLVARHL